MVIMTGLVAASVVRILVSEAKRRVPHLVNRDLSGARRKRVSADSPATATVDSRIHDDDSYSEFGYLSCCHLQSGGRVADQETTNAISAECSVKVRAHHGAGSAGRRRIVSPGIGRADIDSKDVDR